MSPPVDQGIYLVYKKVTTEAEAEMLRGIRNECKDFMTRSTAFITKDQQTEWFKTAAEKYDLFICYEVAAGAVIVDAGYGVIHKNADESLLTGGLLPQYRNKGLGQNVFQYLIDQCDRSKPIRLEVLKTNKRAFSVYDRLGFIVMSEDDRIYNMEYGYDSPI